MPLSQNMIFYDVNYNQYYEFYTGAAINSVSVDYAIDNRSDAGLTTFNAGSVCVLDFRYFPVADTTSRYYITDIFINNHNLGTLDVWKYTGTVWNSLPGAYRTNYTESSYHISFPTVAVQGVRLLGVGPQASGSNLYLGEFIATRKKFQLNFNPSRFSYNNIAIGTENVLWDGRKSWSERANLYSADLGWDYAVGDLNSMTGTDLQNLTELSRQRTEFLFWPNAGNTSGYPNIWGWRPNDVYKCRVSHNATYETPIRGRMEFMPQNFKIQEHN